MGAVGARWAEYRRFVVRQRRFEPGVWRRTCRYAESIYFAISGGLGYGSFCFTSYINSDIALPHPSICIVYIIAWVFIHDKFCFLSQLRALNPLE